MPNSEKTGVPYHHYQNPLKKTLGNEFFLKIPRDPGVYYFLDKDENILYVGKAKNLRNRLNSYKNLNLSDASKKTMQMLHSAESIRWELHSTELQACLRENYLLRLLKPKFNIVN